MKKYMLRGLVCLAMALATVLSFAEETTETDAEMVVRGWSMLNGSTFGALGAVKEVRVERDAQNQVLWYVVVTTGGAVVVAPDTGIEPVLAVLPGSDGNIPKGSALDAMLRRDLVNRLRPLRRPVLKLMSTAVQSALAAPDEVKSAAKWDKLRRLSTMKMMTAGGSPATIVRWLDGWNSPNTRNGVQTLRFWNQTDSDKYFKNAEVFNRDTPDHDPCGCVATAGAAIMHYFRAPSGNVVTRTCSRSRLPIELTTKGGTYDWSLIDGLNLAYGNPIQLDDAQLDLLARVASDCGIGCEMSYAPDGSGSNTCKLQASFRQVFNVAHAQLVTKSGGLYGQGEASDIGAENYAKIIYNQIRSGAPIALGIDGHEVVACGYGIDADETDYTYVFLGWGGQNDAWYALPKIDTKATAEGGWYTSTFIDELITEISFDDNFIAVCGRLVDIDENPIAGGELTLANGEVVTTDANGYWGTRVSPADPDSNYVMDSIGTKHFYEIGEAAKTTTDDGKASAALASALPEAMTVQLLNPSVDVYDGETLVKQHGSINSAVETARGCEEPHIVLTDRSLLQSTCTIDFDCTIRAQGADPRAMAVVCRAGASLKIGNGARVLFENVAFENADGSAVKVSVAANGCAAISGFVGINTLKIAEADSFELAGAITAPIFIDCANRTAGAVFGRVTGVGVEACASMIRNLHDEDLGGKVLGSDLVWADAAVPHDAAVVRLLQDGTEANYLSFDKLLRFVTNDAEIVICKNCSLTNAVTVTNAVTITSEGGPFTVSSAAAARFALEAGGSLTLRNVTFDGNEADRSAPFVTVGDGAALTLANGARIRRFKYTGSSDGGTILLDGGELTMRSGAEIRRCSASGRNQSGQRGGGINAKSGTLNLLGGTIAECSATKNGGGVYTEVPAHVGGALKISGNTPDNLYAFGKDNLIQVGAGMGGAQVMTRNSSAFSPSPNDAGEVFARVTAALSSSALDGLNGAFVNDVDSSLKSKVRIDGSVTNLIWSAGAANSRICPEEDAANARARVIWPNQTTNLWYHAADALTDATDGCIVELLKDDSLAGELVLAGGTVELRTAADARFAVCMLSRELDCRVTVSSGSGLEVTGVIFQCVAASGDAPNTVPFFNIRGGSMTLGADAQIREIYGDESRAADAVVVWESGRFVLDGGEIHDCINWYTDEKSGVESGCGAAILLEGEGSVVELKSGRISNCAAARGGAVFASDRSTVLVSGDASIEGNKLLDFTTPSNLKAADLSGLVLTDDFAGAIGYTEGVDGNTNVFGTVDADYYARAAADEAGLLALSRSAASFSHDLTGAKGVVATNDVRQLLVWSTAVVDGKFVDEDGSVYGVVIVVPPPTEIDPPTAVSALVYTGAEQTGVVASVGFTLTGNVGTNAGPYTAVAKLEEGYVWTGGGVGDVQVDWSIAKATYDMSDVVFTNVTYVCDGSAKSNLVDTTTLPAGVSVTNYLNNGQTEVGTYTVTAQFGGDEVNYEPIADMTATLTIIDSPTPPPGPTPDPVYTNSPSPIAFESITRQSETSWILVVTNREPYCWYRLIYTDDLTKGFTSTGDWVQATVDAPKAWTNKVDFNSGEVSPAYFWRAEGTWGTDEVPPVSPDDRPPAP